MAIPGRGEAGIADLVATLGADSPLAKPETFLRNPPPSPGAVDGIRIRAHAVKGYWPRSAEQKMKSGFCSFRELGEVYEIACLDC